MKVSHVPLYPAQLALCQREGVGDHGQQRDDDEAEQDDETDQHHHVEGVFQHIQDQVLSNAALVRGFLGKPFFDTITPLSEVCRGIAGDSSLLSFLSSVRSLTGGVPSSGRKRLHFLATIIKNS